MTQPSDFKAAVASLLNSFADAANTLADELVTALSSPENAGVTTSGGDVVPGTVSVPAAPSTTVDAQGQTIPAPLAPVTVPSDTTETPSVEANVPEPAPAILSDGTPAPVPEATDPVAVTPTPDTTATPVSSSGEVTEPDGTYSTSTPVDSTTTDATDPTADTTDLGTNS